KMPPNFGNTFTASYEATFHPLAAEKKVPLIPFLLEGVAADPALNLSDGLHPNAAGYVIVAKLVEQYLVPVLDSLARASTAEPAMPAAEPAMPAAAPAMPAAEPAMPAAEPAIPAAEPAR